jgi:hypothetical protein
MVLILIHLHPRDIDRLRGLVFGPKSFYVLRRPGETLFIFGTVCRGFYFGAVRRFESQR